MLAEQHKQIAGRIWEIANRLRGPYRPPQYRLVMLPLIVLRRLDCVLEPTKDAVVAEYERLVAAGTPENAIPRLLTRLVDKDRNQPLYNTSPFTFQKLLGDSENIAPNLIAYINGFSATAREIFDKFKFGEQIEKLDASNRLFNVPLPPVTALPLPIAFGPDMPNDALVAAMKPVIDAYIAAEVMPPMSMERGWTTPRPKWAMKSHQSALLSLQTAAPAQRDRDGYQSSGSRNRGLADRDRGVSLFDQITKQHYAIPPDGWQTKRIKFLSDVQTSNVNKISADDEEPVKLCNYTDVYYNDSFSGLRLSSSCQATFSGENAEPEPPITLTTSPCQFMRMSGTPCLDSQFITSNEMLPEPSSMMIFVGRSGSALKSRKTARS